MRFVQQQITNNIINEDENPKQYWNGDPNLMFITRWTQMGTSWYMYMYSCC